MRSLKSKVDKMIELAATGKNPAQVIHEVLNPKNLGGTDSRRDPNPLGGVDNLVRLVNPGDTAKALKLLAKANLRVNDHGKGILGFDYNSARDSAAQLLTARGIAVRVSG